MRNFVLLSLSLLTLSFSLSAQVNRSANELARETTRDYIANKIFRNQAYRALAYGELKPWADKRSVISWTLDHSFEITHHQAAGFVKAVESKRAYKVLFYLDKQMKVLRAEANSLIPGNEGN